MTHLLSLSLNWNPLFRRANYKLIIVVVTFWIVALCGALPATAQGNPKYSYDASPQGDIEGNILWGASNQSTAGQMQQCSFSADAPSSDGTIINGADTMSFSNGYVNAIAIGLQILGAVWTGPMLISGLKQMAAGSNDAMKKVLLGAAGVVAVFFTPGCVNWLFACIWQ